MRKIVVASHSLLAQGFKDTLEFLTGKGDAVNAVCAYVNDNGEGLDAAVEAALSGTDEVVVLTDAYGGSVNQRFSRFASDRIHVIAGVNLLSNLRKTSWAISSASARSRRYVNAIRNTTSL